MRAWGGRGGRGGRGGELERVSKRGRERDREKKREAEAENLCRAPEVCCHQPASMFSSLPVSFGCQSSWEMFICEREGGQRRRA